MFTFVAVVLIVVVAWYVGRANVKDRAVVARLSDDEAKTAMLQARQDIKLIAFLLGGVIVMLGIVADRLH